MRRADRLFLLLQSLRRARGPVTAQSLAADLEVSRRTIYRDILDLQAARVPIEGEAGVGYVLRPGHDLPPLMFTVEEVEAVALGVRLVRRRAETEHDDALARAADDVLAKVEAVLPGPLATTLATSALFAPARPGRGAASGRSLGLLRRAVRDSLRLQITYVDLAGAGSHRAIWPLALLFYADATLLGGWCELRCDYRFFRVDRITDARAEGGRFDGRRGALLRDMMSRHDGETGTPAAAPEPAGVADVPTLAPPSPGA